ncbi:MAG: Nif3-like dinuclear metal center hexameric protein [Oscillospiraceae bacterium]|jgi:dinuclear metal center YbgI/SA1388 family protein|nr:Nif3-like dinuclear metal center hexameric protein [Oscillospiraceae bacterium]
MTVNDIYLFLEQIAPFKYQESYDNSGFLIGDKNAEITKICVCLDITLDVIDEASEKGANLIISHHPVIFKALSDIKAKTPVHELIKNNINAVCAHTNFDVAVMADLMIELLDFPKNGSVIEVVNPDGAGFGRFSDLSEPITADKLAEKCKQVFKSFVVRYYDSGKAAKRIGVCSGSGGSIIDFALEKDVDALITGEVKHSDIVKAKNFGLTLIEAGHYHTEILFCDFLKKRLYERFPRMPVFIAENSADFCKYI